MREIKIGDFVRSFDFGDRSLGGERACYVEGVVEAIGQPPRGVCYMGCDVYTIRVVRRVFGGFSDTDTAGELVFPPVNGIPTTMGGTTNGVEHV